MIKPRDDRHDDLFRALLDQIINLRHPLVRMAAEIDWAFVAERFSSACRSGPCQPPLPTRLVAGAADPQAHARSVGRAAMRALGGEPVQFFCGEVVFCHALPFDRSWLTHCRQRRENALASLLQESLKVAHQTGALAPKDLERVVLDTTEQEKAIVHPSDARLTHRTIEKLVDLAKREGGVAAELSAVGQARRPHGRALSSRPSVQARPARAHIPAHKARPPHP